MEQNITASAEKNPCENAFTLLESSYGAEHYCFCRKNPGENAFTFGGDAFHSSPFYKLIQICPKDPNSISFKLLELSGLNYKTQIITRFAYIPNGLKYLR